MDVEPGRHPSVRHLLNGVQYDLSCMCLQTQTDNLIVRNQRSRAPFTLPRGTAPFPQLGQRASLRAEDFNVPADGGSGCEGAAV